MGTQSHRNALKPGYMVHWYRIERILGQGGFGITYLAEDTNLNQQVAVKEYLPVDVAVRERDFSVHPVSEDHSESFAWGLERFVDEARTLARFDHPNIVRVLSVFEMNNSAYMVMRYERGRSLQQMLSKRATLEEDRLIEILFPVLEGLERVHAAGFVHRDVKPANIYIRQGGSPVLLDFGSARQSLGEATRTLTTLVSPGYAPFEQYFSNSDRQGPWTDIYGLGATFYRAVTGVAPMNAVDRSEEIIKQHRDPLTPAAKAAAGSYSPHLLDAIDWAVRFREDSRPQNIGEWRCALLGIAAPPEAATARLEAPPAPPGAAEPANENVDFLLEPTARSQPAGTQVLVRKTPKRRRRYWIAGFATLLIVFIGLDASKENSDAAPAASVSEPVSLETNGSEPAQILRPTAVSPVRGHSTDASAEKHSGTRTLRTGNNTRAPITPDAPATTASEEARISSLLDEAREDMDRLRLSTPPGDNALEKYRQVLSLDADNSEAKNGVRKIVETYAQLGRQAARRKDYDRATFFIDQALAIAPDSRPLRRVQRRLKRINRRRQ